MNYHLTIEPYLNPYWLKEDIDYLGRIIKFQVSPQKLKEKLGEENVYLWRQKIFWEDLLLYDLYNLEINFNIHSFEMATVRRLSVIMAQNKLKDRKLKHLREAFNIYPLSGYLNEMTLPVTEQTIMDKGCQLQVFGDGTFIPYARPAGHMTGIVVKEHDASLYYWLKFKEEGKIMPQRNVILHFDAHSDMNLICDEDLEELSDIGDLETLKNWFSSFYYEHSDTEHVRAVVNLTNYLHFAVRTGFAGEIFWIMPDPDFCKLRLAANLMKSFLLEIEGGYDFRTDMGHILCNWEGIKVHILRLRDLPLFNQSVILDIDIDYFINDDSSWNWHGYKILNEDELIYWRNICSKPLEIGSIKPWVDIETFCEMLLLKNIQSPLVTISISPFYTPGQYHLLPCKLLEKLEGN
jgi:hypothetical protein